MWLVVGLGNPGEEYVKTRHNIGFMVVDELSRAFGGDQALHKNFNGLSGKISVAGHTALLLKPQTFMNRSGESVQPAAAFHKIPPNRIIVIHDEMDLPFSDVRLKKSGGHGGHNGLRDIIRALGDEFIRVRMGIGKPLIKGTEANYVLSTYRKEEQNALADQISFARDAVEAIVHHGVETAQMQFNRKK